MAGILFLFIYFTVRETGGQKTLPAKKTPGIS
jgi:hypothetical protein